MNVDPKVETLVAEAYHLFPHSEYLQQQWLNAVAWMRQDLTKPKWVLDGAKVDWGQ